MQIFAHSLSTTRFPYASRSPVVKEKNIEISKESGLVDRGGERQYPYYFDVFAESSVCI